MQSHGVHQLPTVDEAGRLVGIVTDRDVRSALGYCDALGDNLLESYDATLRDNLVVSEIMTTEPTTIALRSTLDEALGLLCHSSFNALPVMDGHRLCGIITKNDLLRAFHHVLGLDKEGTRVEIALPGLWRDLRDASTALAQYDGQVHSMVVASMRRDGDEPVLYLRASGSSGRQLEDVLRRSGLVVLVPEHK
jgi:acetoin utilization protein AcuB